ncbi:hypothetical protein RB195_010708 [Necator americanus]|uniref:Uncharacterized protein n=1 Tax=Necator americanus TaxID=51031 RepID=A0ABR1CZ74_NECAM
MSADLPYKRKQTAGTSSPTLSRHTSEDSSAQLSTGEQLTKNPGKPENMYPLKSLIQNKPSSYRTTSQKPEEPTSLCSPQ